MAALLPLANGPQVKEIGLGPGRLASLFETLGQCVNDLNMPLEQALPCASRNAADALGFKHLTRRYASLAA